MYTDETYFETTEQMLQETKGCFIVLDRNDCLVFCNEILTVISSESVKSNSILSEVFWLKKDLRTFHLSEFKYLIGQEVELLYKNNLNCFTEIVLSVEELKVSNQTLVAIKPIDIPLKPTDSLRKSEKITINQLVRDLPKGNFTAHYQPQVNTRTKELFGIEALARWDKDNQSSVSPDVFIQLAEDANFIAELDIWILNHVCQQLTVWQLKGIEIPMTSVNFSPLSLNSSNICIRILETLNNNNIPPNKITIEITEGQKIKYDDQVISSIIDLQSTGITLSLDDFGIGYSNFKRLATIPITQVKLDRSFVLSLPDKFYTEICQSTLSLGEKVGLTVIAEGVENADQLEILENLGCHVFQGYYFSKPLPEAEFEQWFFNINNCWER